ncbi:MAG: ferredoxin [Candidatus Nanoarchaeia archaeon]
MAVKIIYKKNACIGAGECVNVAPKLWDFVQGKAVLKSGKEVKPGVFELVTDEPKARQSAQSCPAFCIEVVDGD